MIWGLLILLALFFACIGFIRASEVIEWKS